MIEPYVYEFTGSLFSNSFCLINETFCGVTDLFGWAHVFDSKQKRQHQCRARFGSNETSHDLLFKTAFTC